MQNSLVKAYTVLVVNHFLCAAAHTRVVVVLIYRKVEATCRTF